jgi:hypothetical protein
MIKGKESPLMDMDSSKEEWQVHVSSILVPFESVLGKTDVVYIAKLMLWEVERWQKWVGGLV